MARRLINEQGYSKDNLQVLLGGWGHWKELHAADPKKYPTVPETLPVAPPQVQQPAPVLPPTATVSK